MATFKIKRGAAASLSSLAKEEGSLIFTKDDGKLYIDTNSTTRVAINAAQADQVAQALTFNNGGSGAASGTTFDGSTARTISYNTIGAAASGHKHSAADITSGTLAVARGGTGQTTLKDSANSLLNALDTGSSTPADNDYYISQYVNGGTTTTTYHRRPMSALWTYISGKLGSTYAAASHTHAATDITSGTLALARIPTGTTSTTVALGNHTHSTYMPKSGGTFTGRIGFTANTGFGETLPTTATEGDLFFQLTPDLLTETIIPLPAGGTTGQILKKFSNADGDAYWVTPDDANKVGNVTIGGANQNFYLSNGTPTVGNSFIPTTGGTYSGSIWVSKASAVGQMGIAATSTNAGSVYLQSENSTTGLRSLYGSNAQGTGQQLLKFDQNGYGTAIRMYGSVWNDYAEYRTTTEVIQPGRVIVENGDDTLSLSIERMQAGAEIVSDTFGFAIGETEQSKTPIAVSGRVLAYPFEDREVFSKNIGMPVCSGPNGTVSIMAAEEAKDFPWCIIGTISAIPTYDTWGHENVPVDGRVWIKVR